MPLDQYVIGSVIGKGSYGEVTLATYKKDKKKYVIKTIDLHNASKKERTYAQQEVEILSKLRHPNIVSYKESFQTENGSLAIVMGYCEGGDLYTKLKKQAKCGEYLPEAQIVEWFVQIAMALQYMHDRHILHRDLKTQNIFLTKSKIIKLGDLGIARVLENNVDMATTMIGTPYYMSPELFSNKPYNHKSDVWALGCCVYEMATLKHAFNAKDMNSLVYKILKGKTPPMPKRYTEELQDIIRSMLYHDPSSRPSASRILRHPFIKKHIAIFLEGTKSRRKSKEERVRKSIPKLQSAPSDDSGFSEPLSGSHQQAIATSSNIDVEIINTQKEQKEEQVQKTNNEKSEKDSKTTDSSKSRKSSEVRKIISDRIQTKAKLKKEARSKSEEYNVDESEPVSSGDKSSGKANKPVRKHSRESVERKKKTENSKRPLPRFPNDKDGYSEGEDRRLPVPKFKETASSCVNSEGSKSPKVSSGVPNMAARRKRRQKQQEKDASFTPPPALEKKDSIASIVDSYTPRSHEEIVKAHLQRISHKEESDQVDGISPDEQTSFDEVSADEPSSKNEDVSSLINNLQATLKLDSKASDRQSPEDSYDSSSGGDFSPSATGRLNDRIVRLRRECIEGVGEAALQKAYRIIDTKPEHQIESALVNLMGRKKFDLYSGQIWQLKFCEEFKL